ncbi:MAG TPA: formyltetrahydrofolate deformylase [Solirubrobacteraceae bacterium]|nr:formyltetrahydrofolate deformylase [Solirubrobacteraceae bacterium]
MTSSPPDAAHGANHTARLLISCADGPGIVAAISGFLFEQGANIISSDQYSTHPEHGTFFMRSAFYLPAIEDGLKATEGGAPAHGRNPESPASGAPRPANRPDAREGSASASAARRAFEAAFAEQAERFEMEWRIAYAHERRRVALMASRADHCVLDLLWRASRGELDMEVVCVISNHPDLRAAVEAMGVRFVHIPVTKETKPRAEAEALELLSGSVDLLVLARYMQILSEEFLARVGCPVINIHHSFLPAFAGAEPYRHAYERGVKLIGATAHFVTEGLDEGPIIEQDVIRVGHDYTVTDLERVGRDVERSVLARAVRMQLEDRVLVHEGRTIVF